MYNVGKLLLFFFFSFELIFDPLQNKLLVKLSPSPWPLPSAPPFPSGLWTWVDEGGSSEDLKHWVSVKASFFLVLLPHISVPLNTAPEEEQPFKQGWQWQGSFSCHRPLPCLSRAETHLGKEGLAFCRSVSFSMPFHFCSFFLSGETRMVGWRWENPSQGPFLSPCLSGWGWDAWPRQCAHRMLGYFQGFNLYNISEFMENLWDLILLGRVL